MPIVDSCLECGADTENVCDLCDEDVCEDCMEAHYDLDHEDGDV